MTMTSAIFAGMLTEGIDNGASQPASAKGEMGWGEEGCVGGRGRRIEQQGTATDRVSEDKNSILLLLKTAEVVPVCQNKS